jgi:purine nucleosidase
MDFYRMVNGIDGCPLHDPLALGLALNPTFLVREPYHVEVVSTPESPETDGMTIADHRPCQLFKAHEKAVTEVCVSVDAVAFLNDFLTTMRNTV